MYILLKFPHLDTSGYLFDWAAIPKLVYSRYGVYLTDQFSSYHYKGIYEYIFHLLTTSQHF